MKRVFPPETGKPGKITVRRAQQESVLDGQRGQVGVGNEIGRDALAGKQSGENLQVAFCGLRDPDRWTIKPFIDLPPGFIECLRLFKNARVCDEAEKCQGAGPGQSHRRRAVETGIEP